MRASLILAGVLALSAPSFAAVDVRFVEPDTYTDLRSETGMVPSRKDVLAQLQQQFEKLGAQYLRPGQDLKVDVLDIDLAGEIEWWRGGFDHPRVLREITPPSMRVRYTLEENGQVVASGEDRITNRNYLMDGLDRSHTTALYYEKTMLNRWFKDRFAPPKKS